MKGNVFMYLEKQLEDVAAKIERKVETIDDMQDALMLHEREIDDLNSEIEDTNEELKGLQKLEADLEELLY